VLWEHTEGVPNVNMGGAGKDLRKPQQTSVPQDG